MLYTRTPCIAGMRMYVLYIRLFNIISLDNIVFILVSFNQDPRDIPELCDCVLGDTIVSEMISVIKPSKESFNGE